LHLEETNLIRKKEKNMTNGRGGKKENKENAADARAGSAHPKRVNLRSHIRRKMEDSSLECEKISFENQKRN